MITNHAELIAEAKAILSRAAEQGREISDFEAGRCDALLDLAKREQKAAKPSISMRQRQQQ